jgi:F-type H+-transporting ATPase subunit delta
MLATPRDGRAAATRIHVADIKTVFVSIRRGGFGANRLAFGASDLAGSSSSSLGAQRYAAAVFDLALDTGEVDAVDNGLKALAQLIDGDQKLSRALKSPLHKSEEKAAVLAAIGEKLKLPELARRFVGVTAMNRRAGELPAMARAFADLAARHRGSSRVVARVAHSISDDQVRQLESAVSKSLGKNVTIDVEVDPALIGGLQLKMGSRLVDASIRTKLNALTNLMKGA